MGKKFFDNMPEVDKVALSQSLSVDKLFGSLQRSIALYSTAASFYLNYAGGQNSNSEYKVVSFKVSPGRTYRLKGQITSTSDANGIVAYGFFGANLSTAISGQLINQVKDTTKVYDITIVAPSSPANYIRITQKIDVDSVVLTELPTSGMIYQILGTMPWYGKKVFFIGDSYTMHGYYFSKFLELTGMTSVGSTGSLGNGQQLTWMPYLMLNNFSAEIMSADMITVLSGTNDYSYDNRTIGNIDDEPPTVENLISGSQATTIYAGVKAIVNAAMYLNPNLKVVFFSQPERGTYDSKPVDVIPPAANVSGVSMYNMALAIEDCCKLLGVAYVDTHQKLWNFQQIGIYTSDNLHPTNTIGGGGEILGREMALGVNQL